MSSFKINKTLPLNPRANQSLDTQKKALEGKMRGAAQMYEKMFIRDMVQAMRKTVQHSELSKPTMAEKIYQDKMYENYVDQWSKSDKMGLSKIIYQQLLEKFSPYHRNQLAPPSGPIPLDKSQPIPIQQGKAPGSQPIPVNGKPATTSEMNMMLKTIGADKQVSAPWEGEIVGVVNGLEDRKLLRIQHPQGLISQIGFVGKLDNLALGDTVSAGQRIGALGVEQNTLNWTVDAG